MVELLENYSWQVAKILLLINIQFNMLMFDAVVYFLGGISVQSPYQIIYKFFASSTNDIRRARSLKKIRLSSNVNCKLMN